MGALYKKFESDLKLRFKVIDTTSLMILNLSHFPMVN